MNTNRPADHFDSDAYIGRSLCLLGILAGTGFAAALIRAVVAIIFGV